MPYSLDSSEASSSSTKLIEKTSKTVSDSNHSLEPDPWVSSQNSTIGDLNSSKISKEDYCRDSELTNDLFRSVVINASEFINDLFNALQDYSHTQLNIADESNRNSQNDLFNHSETNNSTLSHIHPWTGDWATPALSQELSRACKELTTDGLEETAQRVIQAVSNQGNNDYHNKQIVLGTRQITIFASSDPDSVCSVSLLKTSLSARFGIEFHLIVVSCYAHLRQAFLVEKSRGYDLSSIFQSACLLFINVGSRQDIRKLLHLYIPSDRLLWLPQLFIIDYHRPFSPYYFFERPKEMKCVAVTTTEELDTVHNESTRILSGLKHHFPKKNSNEDLLLDHDDLDEFLVTNDVIHIDETIINSIGEYHGPPSVLVIFEALSHHNLETPGMFFTTATGLGYHLLSGSLPRHDYCRYMENLQGHFSRMKRRCWRNDRGFEIIKSERHELLLPLLRFNTIENGVKYSTLFLRAQTARFATVDVAEKELASIRVQLRLQEGIWGDQFRFLPVRDQHRLLKRLLPDVLSKATLSSRRRQIQQSPDIDDTQGLIHAPAFITELCAVGLPDRLSSLDASLLLLGLLSRPAPLFSSSQNKTVTIENNLSSSTESVQDEDFNLKQSTSMSSAFKPLHATNGYVQPLFGKSFLEGLQLLESFTNIQRPDDKVISYHNGHYSESGTTLSTPAVWFFGNLWDTYCGTHSNDFGSENEYRVLSSLVAIVIQLQKDIIHFVLRLLGKRRPGLSETNHFRKAIGNIEGFIEESVPRHLHHPLLLRYIAALTSDCIARGVSSALPAILLLAGAPHNSESGTIITAYQPTSTIRNPSKMGLYIQDRLEDLRLAGKVDLMYQDGFDATIAYVPNNKAHILFSSLFPKSFPRSTTNVIPSIPNKILSDPDSDSHSSDDDDDRSSLYDFTDPPVSNKQFNGESSSPIMSKENNDISSEINQEIMCLNVTPNDSTSSSVTESNHCLINHYSDRHVPKPLPISSPKPMTYRRRIRRGTLVSQKPSILKRRRLTESDIESNSELSPRSYNSDLNDKNVIDNHCITTRSDLSYSINSEYTNASSPIQHSSQSMNHHVNFLDQEISHSNEFIKKDQIQPTVNELTDINATVKCVDNRLIQQHQARHDHAAPDLE